MRGPRIAPPYLLQIHVPESFYSSGNNGIAQGILGIRPPHAATHLRLALVEITEGQLEPSGMLWRLPPGVCVLGGGRAKRLLGKKRGS